MGSSWGRTNFISETWCATSSVIAESPRPCRAICQPTRPLSPRTRRLVCVMGSLSGESLIGLLESAGFKVAEKLVQGGMVPQVFIVAQKP